MTKQTTAPTGPDTTAAPVALGATVLGSPRIGRRRELKRAVEGYWAGRVDADALAAVASGIRHAAWEELRSAGHDSVPVGTFSLYDQVLDTTVLLGAVPARILTAVADERGDAATAALRTYFAAARGTTGQPPLEMTKWFDTNYHYLVPELDAQTTFSAHPEKLLAEVAEAQAAGVPARPVVIGPLTYLGLSKTTDRSDPLALLDRVLPVYEQILAALAATGVSWIQVDEPILVTDLPDVVLGRVQSVVDRLAAAAGDARLLVATYFGDASPALPALAASKAAAIALDLVAGPATVAALPDLADKLLVAGVVDGRNVWRTDLDSALATLRAAAEVAGGVAVASSCSLLHVPYGLDAETRLDTEAPGLRDWLAFGAEKIAEIALLRRAFELPAGTEPSGVVGESFAAARAALSARARDPRVHRADVRARTAAVTVGDRARSPFPERILAQNARTPLPPLPTTTIGSFPQTGEIRVARAAHRSGELDDTGYRDAMCREIEHCVRLQEQIGLDVLVHGEPERNDMVQYFAERLDGYWAGDHCWVQSYGTRCVRPPILFGDVRRPSPMTVEWFTYAQSLTTKPMKGMLTGPVTMLAWSFVRADLPVGEVADQVALAIRDETVDLEAAGAAIIQVDEPALRELLPPRAVDQPAYLDWAVGSFRLATAGVRDDTSVHTHMCYSEFGELIGAIEKLDADVTSIEAARSRMEVVADLRDAGFDLGVGPGVYDIHSPRVPSTAELTELLRLAVGAVPSPLLWVNPDCGLKTRGEPEVVASLRNLVAATVQVRTELPDARG